MQHNAIQVTAVLVAEIGNASRWVHQGVEGRRTGVDDGPCVTDGLWTVSEDSARHNKATHHQSPHVLTHQVLLTHALHATLLYKACREYWCPWWKLQVPHKNVSS